MNADIVAGTTMHFGVLVVVALEPHEPGRQGRHSRDQLHGRHGERQRRKDPVAP